MKRSFWPHVIKEMQIKTIRYYYIPIRMVKIQNSNNTKCWPGYSAKGTFIHLPIGTQNGTAPLEASWAVFFIKLHTNLSYDPAVMPLGIYAKELNTYITQNLHLFIPGFLVIAKTCK